MKAYLRGLVALAGVGAFSAASGQQRTAFVTTHAQRAQTSKLSLHSTSEQQRIPSASSALDRRSVLRSAFAAPLLTPLISPNIAVADSGAAAQVSPQDLLAKLRRIPCFAIVDKDGVPYMIVDKGARGATGYFFLTFRGALSVLGDAQQTAKEQGYEKVWQDAKITTVPLDIAVQLSLKKRERSGQNDMKLDTIVDILPGADEREDALKLDSSGKFNEQGRVPLFYVPEGMEAEDGSLPVYFSKDDLLADWDRLYSGKKEIPRVKVMDLLDLFQKTLRGSNDMNIAFVPTDETMKVAVELQSRKLTAPYKSDRMVMVGGKS